MKDEIETTKLNIQAEIILLLQYLGIYVQYVNI